MVARVRTNHLHFSLSKLMLFTIANVFGGLLQLWLLYGILAYFGKDRTVAVLLGDGGVFFFATSLTATSLLVFFADYAKHPSHSDLLVTVGALVGGGVAIFYYTLILSNRLGNAEPFKQYWPIQVFCAAIAFSYAVFVSARTGYFSR